jgi:hypothetical protein
MMHGQEKSDSCVVAKKPANKPGQPGAESVERRRGAEGNTGEPRTRRTQSRVSVSQEFERVRQAATFACRQTHGRSRMPESGPFGSVRGARGNARPYRDTACTEPFPVGSGLLLTDLLALQRKVNVSCAGRPAESSG